VAHQTDEVGSGSRGDAPRPAPEEADASSAGFVFPSREAFGLAIIISGLPLGYALRAAMGFDSGAVFPLVPVSIGMLLMLQPSWLVRVRVHGDPRLVVLPLLLLFIPFVVMGLIDTNAMLEVVAYDTILSIIMVMMMINDTEKFDGLPEALTLVGLLSCLTPFIQVATQVQEAAIGRLSLEGNSNAILVGYIGGITMLAAFITGLMRRGGNIALGLVAGLAFAISIAASIFSATRSLEGAQIFCLALTVIYLLWRRRPAGRGYRFSILYSTRAGFLGAGFAAAVVAPLVLVALFSQKALDAFALASSARNTGALNALLLGGDYGDTSSAVRLEYWRYAWDRLSFFGAGMSAQTRIMGQGAYTHLTYLQAFYDGGIPFGVLYLVIMVVIPLVLIVLRVKRGMLSPTDLMIALIWIFSQGGHLAHGDPYAWIGLLPVAMLYALFSRGLYDGALRQPARLGAPRLV
jgi:hypothetical protein